MEKNIMISSTKGLHAQLANKLVQLSNKYEAKIFLSYDNVIIDAKSILGLMSLAVPHGENVKVVADGRDAEEAIHEIEKLLG